MVTSGHFSSPEVTALPVCEPCLEGKMTMRPFKAKGYRAKEVLDLVYIRPGLYESLWIYEHQCKRWV